MLLKSLILKLLVISILSALTVTSPVEPGKSLAQKKLKLFRYLLRFVSDELLDDADKTERCLRILSWNVYAPIRINKTYLTATGNDVNLVRTDLRMYVIAKQIIETDADIVHIQEIQVDTYEILNGYLKGFYNSAGFTPHGPTHWPTNPGVTNVRNGVTIYYRKDRFVLQGSEPFQTSQNGNFAQAVTLKRMGEDGFATGPPIVSVNIHFHHGITGNSSALRVSQGGGVHKKITEITANLLNKEPTETPLVIVGGDFNSKSGFPGIDQFTARGYIDVRIVTNNTVNSIYYPELVINPFFPPLRGLPIDTFLVPTMLVNSKKLSIKSLDVADVTEEENSEDGYISKVLSNVAADMRRVNLKRNASKAILESLVNIMSDGNDYDTRYNRAMRIGSDHVPVLATFCTSA